jgi:GNAT superfamily N-acetyltransferase
VTAETVEGKLVGVCFVRFSQLRVEGHLRDAAFLHSIVVHPDHRRQGIAAQMTQWCVERIQERIGPEGVIYAGVQERNDASFATAQKWMPETVGYFYGSAVPMRSQPPKLLTGIVIRAAGINEFDEISRHLNTFYQNHNFSPYETSERLESWLQNSPFDTPFRHYYIAVDDDGNLLAGLGLTESYRATELHVVRMPAYMRWLNKILKVVPQDGIMRRLGISKIWFAPNQLKVAQHLWESLRWQYRDKGNSLMFFFDPTSPVAKIPKIPFWMPKAKLTMVANKLTQTGQPFPIYPP